MSYQVVSRTVSAQPLAAVRQRVPFRDIGRTWKSAMDHVWKVSVLGVFLLIGATHAVAQKADPIKIKNLRIELENMMEEDQRFRTRVEDVEKKYGPNSKELEALWKEQTDLDNRLLKRLEEIIKEYGWPGKSLVGPDASLAAFLIIQHAAYEYQKKYFPLMNEAMKKGEIEPRHLALLEDRILMREGKKQIYGSQLTRNEATGKFELWPIEDEENLDKRRSSVGLDPIADYVKNFGITYVAPKKRPNQH
jgi:hypothetical protein